MRRKGGGREGEAKEMLRRKRKKERGAHEAAMAWRRPSAEEGSALAERRSAAIASWGVSAMSCRAAGTKLLNLRPQRGISAPGSAEHALKKTVLWLAICIAS